jgi:undecaprenyl pyrophosphate phosphatase UppP
MPTRPPVPGGADLIGMVGIMAIRFMLRFLANHSLRIFAYYRFVLAAVVAMVIPSSGS